MLEDINLYDKAQALEISSCFFLSGHCVDAIAQPSFLQCPNKNEEYLKSNLINSLQIRNICIQLRSRIFSDFLLHICIDVTVDEFI